MVDACAWKSGKDLVRQDQIEWLLSLLLEAEKRRWLTSISPVNSAEHHDLQPQENETRNDLFVDPGLHLLRHGQCIDRIHSYFRRLEPNHYCLNATTNNNNPDRPSSQMKVVSNESLTDSTRTAASTDSFDTQEPRGNLSPRHPLFELYKNALLCAKYPVLSVSQPASPSTPYSPALSPSTVSASVQQRKFSFSKVPNPSLVPSEGAMSPSSDGCISPEVSLPILSDALQELVRNVFGLSRREHKFLCETVIPHQVPQAKDPKRLLVETLLSQRVVLERNHHPFYSVQAFMDKNAYQDWLVTEKEKIDHLIKSFWHSACPHGRELPLQDQEFHKQYVDLMKRLIRHESKNKEPNPVHGGVTPTSPLSSQACKLLKQFELRYGVGSLFCKISYLDYLVKYLENDLWYIQHVTVCLQDVVDHALRCPEIYVEKEFKMLLSILSDLLGKTKYLLTRIRKIFPENTPKDGVPALVALFELSLESGRQVQLEFQPFFSTLRQAQLFARNLSTEPLGDILASYVKTEMDSRYERLKVIALDELRQGDFLSPQLLIKVILEIRQEVKDYSAAYHVAFSRYFDMMELAAIKFYSLLMADVEQFCANPPRACRRNGVQPIMLCLAFRLSKLDKDWAKFIPFSHQMWRQPFQEFALQWLDSIGRYFQVLVPQLIRHDIWRAAEVNFTVSENRNHTGSQRRPVPQRPMVAKSASLLSLTPSQHSAFNAVSPSASASVKTNTSERTVSGMRDNEQSRRYTMGSSPPLRAGSPKRRGPGMTYGSSSDEDTQHGSRSRRRPKLKQVHQVAAQIHEPRGKAGPNAKAKNLQKNNQEENPKKVTSAASACEPSKEETSTNVEGKLETKHSSGDLEQGLSIPRNQLGSTEVQDLPGKTGDILKIGECNEKEEYESVKLDREIADNSTTLSTCHAPDNAKPGSPEPQNNNNLETISVESENVQDGSTKKKSPDYLDPNSADHSGCSEESQRGFNLDGSEGYKGEPTTVSIQSGNAGVGCLAQTLEKEQPDETDIAVKSSLDRESTEKAETSAPNKTQESSEEDCVSHVPGNGSHSEDASIESEVNMEGISESHCTKNMNGTRQQEEVEEALPEEGLTSGCPRNSSGSCTPFENDSTDDSDSETLMHASGSSHLIESVDVASARSKTLPNAHRQERQGDPDKRGSRISPARKLIAQDVEPVENGGLTSKGQDGSDSCVACPARDICIRVDTDRENTSSCNEGGHQRSDDNKASTLSMDPKAAHISQSAPVKIPAQSNKRISRLRDTSCGSFGSTLSECGSFLSAHGSVHSANSIETFHSARSKRSSPQPDQSRSRESTDDQSDKNRASQHCQSTVTDEGDDHTRKTQSADDARQVLPISSSLVDVICAVNRLATFVCHLCNVFCPDESVQRDDHAAEDELRNESMRIKRRLCTRLIQVILSFVKLYSDNVLGMETCGLSEELLAEILDERVQRHLKLQREAGHLQGCRYNPLARQCCNTRDGNGRFIPPCEGIAQTETNPGQYEPITQQMGVRISSVTILRSILPWLLGHVTTAVNNPDSLLSARDHYLCSSESKLSYSLFYCENGPSLDGFTNNTAAEATSYDVPQPRSDELHDPAILNNDTEHFCRLETAQVKLVTHRINKFFKQVVRYLLDLNLPRYSIRKRLRPAMEFLSRELQRFHGVLFPESFNKLLTEFWSAVAEFLALENVQEAKVKVQKNFKEECLCLVRRRSSASEHSKLLLQAVAYLMEFFHAGGVGLALEKLAGPLDATIKHLQLYTSPTDNLISMYNSLYKQVLIMQQQYRVDELTSSVSVSSHQASANAPADFVIQALCKELHITRKCFSGAQLVEWVKNYVLSHGYDNLGVCIGSTETETGLEFGQYLLERGMIICVSPPPLFNQQSSPRDRRIADESESVDNMPAERGRVFINEEPPPDIRINNITVTTRGNTDSPTSNSRSTSRSTTVHDSESQDEADDQYEDDDDFLGSGSDLWNRLNSTMSERDATFYNHHKAFYKFISEEDTSRTEIKISLGINDRLNLPAKLKHILCVLYTRRDTDRNARNFLRRLPPLPRELLDEAIGGGRDALCYSLRVCQAL